MSVSDVPAELGVPVSAGFDPIVTCVELLNPVPVRVIVCAEVAPAIKPVLGENAVCVGTALSICVAASVLDLSVVAKSLGGSETVAEFVTVKIVAEEIALGPTETVKVIVLLPPFAVRAPTVAFVQVTTCAAALQVPACSRAGNERQACWQGVGHRDCACCRPGAIVASP